MTTVEDVLRERGFASTTEHQVAQALRVLLPTRTHGPALDAGQREFLAAHGGVPVASRRQLSALDARSAARAAAEAVEALTRNQLAERLGVHPTRISHRVEAGELYSYRVGRNRSVFPDWQLVGDQVLPHLGQVLAALPRGAHPVSVRAFMTTADDALTTGTTSLSPVAWLAGGGDPAPVAELATTLGEQV